MIVTGGARRRRRVLALGLLGTLIAAALVLGHNPGVTQAAEATDVDASAKPAKAASAKKPAKAASAKKKVGTNKAKATAKKKKSTTLAKAKHPLPPPPKPARLAAAAQATAAATAPAAGGTAEIDITVNLDRGVAEVTPTASRPAEIKVEPASALPPTEPDKTAAGAVPKPLANVSGAASALPPPVESKVAAAPPGPAVTLTKESLRIQFAPDGSDLPESAGQSIGELAALMSREPSLRLQLLAFAAGTKETASQSRRLSLNRALAVRGALIDAGVRSTRIDVRALGSQTEESPLDRVDVLVMQRGGG